MKELTIFRNGVEYPKFPGMTAEAAANALAKELGGVVRQVYSGWAVMVDDEESINDPALPQVDLQSPAWDFIEENLTPDQD